MKALVVVLAAAILGAGVVGLASPRALMRFVSAWRHPRRRLVHALARIAVGALLGAVAPETQAPHAVQILAVVCFASGVLALLLRPATLFALLSWWLRQSSRFIRTWSALAAACGAFLLWATLK